MRRLAFGLVVMSALACSGGGAPGGSGGGLAGSGGDGGSGGTGGSAGSGGSGGTAEAPCASKTAACEACVRQTCHMGDLLGQCLTGVPDLCPQAWADFKACACTARRDVTAWAACLQSWQSSAGIEGVVLGDCLQHECEPSCFGP